MSGSAAQIFDPFAAAGWTAPPANDDNAAKPTLPDAEYARIEQLASQPSDGAPSYTGTTVARAPSAPTAPAAMSSTTFDPFQAAGWTAEASQPAAAAPASSTVTPTPQHQAITQPIKDAVQSIMQSLQTVPPEESGPLATPPAQGVTQSLQHGYTLGLDEILAPLIPAAAESAATGKPFSQVYDDVAQQMRAPRVEFEQQHPYAAAALSTVGAAGAPNVFGPFFSGAPAASTLGQVGNLTRNVAAGAGTGAVTGGLMTDGDIQQRLEGARQGAEFGGAFSAIAPPLVSAFTAGGRGVKSVFSPNSQTDALAGRVLLDQTGGVIPTFEPSPIPGTPLDIAQASGNPELASLVDTRSAGAGLPAEKRQVAAQNQALLSTAPRSALAPLQGPEVQAEQASTRATSAVQKAERISNTEENRVWNKPSLVKPSISSASPKTFVANAINKMREDESGLALAIDDSGALRRTISELTQMPDKIAANQINAISSRFRKIARDPNESADVRLVAQRLANETQEGIWQAPEVAGRPAKVISPVSEIHTLPDGTTETVQIAGRAIPDIKPDPELVRDLRAAREFTKREAQVFGHASFDNILNRNSRGNQTVTPGTALNRFFDFGSGTERPGAIRNVSQFMDDIRSEWLKLNNAGGTYDPTMIDTVKSDLLKNTRDFVIAKMLGRVSGVPTDMNGERIIQAGQLNKWLDTNRPMLERTGLFDKSQLDALDAMQKTAAMIQRGKELGKPVNSATYSRLSNEKRWLDVFMSPFTNFVVGSALGGAIGGTVGHFLGEGGLGAILGAEGGGTAGMGAAILQRLYSAPREVVLQKLDEAIRNPAIAKDLMQKAAAKRPMSPETQRWLRSWLVTIPVSQAARTLSPEPTQ